MQSGEFTLMVSGQRIEFAKNPSTYSFRLKIKGWDQIRWEVERPEGTFVNLIHKNAGWTITPNSTQQVSIGGLVGRQLELLPFLAVAKWLHSSDVDIGPASLETIDGQRLYRILIRPKPPRRGMSEFQNAFEKMSQAELLVDATTLLPSRFRYFAHPGDWRVNIPMELVFTDYLRVGAHLIPTRVAQYLRGQKMDEYQIQSVQFNPTFDANDFAMR